MRWGILNRSFWYLNNIFHVQLDCNLFEINISYRFEDIKTINLLCQQSPMQFIVTEVFRPWMATFYTNMYIHQNECLTCSLCNYNLQYIYPWSMELLLE